MQYAYIYSFSSSFNRCALSLRVSSLEQLGPSLVPGQCFLTTMIGDSSRCKKLCSPPLLFSSSFSSLKEIDKSVTFLTTCDGTRIAAANCFPPISLPSSRSHSPSVCLIPSKDPRPARCCTAHCSCALALLSSKWNHSPISPSPVLTN